MARRDPAQLLAAARLELARRGDPTWAPVLRRFEQEAGALPDCPTGLPHAEALEAWIRTLSAEQRSALRRLLDELGLRAEPSSGHGEGTEYQRRGCMCAPCDPLACGERGAQR